ncbi:MAG TPA: LacI family DNA-binding transcriptional regulator [Streptosporangiaceae bacterium]|nr:LacI family DNA-binding transcriptional regulator [Streptosporangiaceae bacterium]
MAAAAGVSRQTVSNVLNAPGRVAPATTERVRRAIDELGYRPNRAARNLRGRTSGCIGFKIHASAGVSNLLDRFLHALAAAAETAGYHVLIFAPAPVDEELAAYQDLIRTGTVDGFVLADVAHEDRRLPWFAKQGIPFVCFGRPWGHEDGRFAWADVDGAYGVARAVDHLIALGHRRVAYLGWPAGTGFGDERRAGWRQAMRRHGAATGGLDGACPEDVATATKAAGALLVQPDPPTAFACGSDTFAVAARIAGGVDSAGLPNVEVVGFDDSPAAMLMSPPMSSVRQPVTEVARHLVGLLVDQLRGSDVPPEGVMFRPELVSRGRPRPGER